MKSKTICRQMEINLKNEKPKTRIVGKANASETFLGKFSIDHAPNGLRYLLAGGCGFYSDAEKYPRQKNYSKKPTTPASQVHALLGAELTNLHFCRVTPNFLCPSWFYHFRQIKHEHKTKSLHEKQPATSDNKNRNNFSNMPANGDRRQIFAWKPNLRKHRKAITRKKW